MDGKRVEEQATSYMVKVLGMGADPDEVPFQLLGFITRHACPTCRIGTSCLASVGMKQKLLTRPAPKEDFIDLLIRYNLIPNGDLDCKLSEIARQRLSGREETDGTFSDSPFRSRPNLLDDLDMLGDSMFNRGRFDRGFGRGESGMKEQIAAAFLASLMGEAAEKEEEGEALLRQLKNPAIREELVTLGMAALVAHDEYRQEKRGWWYRRLSLLADLVAVPFQLTELVVARVLRLLGLPMMKFLRGVFDFGKGFVSGPDAAFLLTLAFKAPCSCALCKGMRVRGYLSYPKWLVTEFREGWQNAAEAEPDDDPCDCPKCRAMRLRWWVQARSSWLKARSGATWTAVRSVPERIVSLVKPDPFASEEEDGGGS